MTGVAMDQFLVRQFGVLPESITLVQNCEEELAEQFSLINDRAERRQYYVLDAFRRNEVSSRHFNATTGYGYGDEGRDKLARVFADVFRTEDAIVSPLIMSGTHAISMVLYGLLRPGDEVLCVTGTPYDTMQRVISGGDGSLEEMGIQFETVPLTEGNVIDLEAIRGRAGQAHPKIIYMQRSTGYAVRPAFTTQQLAAAISRLRELFPDAVYFVDNCYGEFVNDEEPSEAGADVIAGSLIKNPGGGLAPTGGYIAGREQLIEIIAGRYSAPGVGREIGSYAAGYQPFYQGLFMAPHTVGQALKGAVLASAVFRHAGFDVTPGPMDERGDITQVIGLGNAEALTGFVRGVQRASAVDAHVVPYAWDMPGYEDEVIMAAGTFVAGASLELTADAPIRPPFTAYLQGGLTYSHAKLGVLCALSDVLRAS